MNFVTVHLLEEESRLGTPYHCLCEAVLSSGGSQKKRGHTVLSDVDLSEVSVYQLGCQTSVLWMTGLSFLRTGTRVLP